MKSLAFVLVILSNGKIINEELVFISLRKCELYENQINREVKRMTYNYSAYCRPEVIDGEGE